MKKLLAPSSWNDASASERAKFTNGCGPQSAFFDAIPKYMRNFLFGLDVGCACDIHDWMYEHGKTPVDKIAADEIFYRNMKALINDRGGFLTGPRLTIAWIYYEMVSRFGRDSFGSK